MSVYRINIANFVVEYPKRSRGFKSGYDIKMLVFNKQKLEQATTHLLENKTNFMESTIGKVFSTDECGSISINSAASGNYGFFIDLQMIAKSVEKDGIMEALCYRRLTDINAQKWKRLIDKLLSEAQLEYEELKEFQPVFLGEFAPKQIDCFKKADQLLKESSFTINKCMEIFEEFTKKPKYPQQRRMIAGYEREWNMTHTILATKTPQTHFDFMYDSFTPEGQELIESFQSLMEKVDKLMDLCCQTLELEAIIKSDPKQLNMIHNRQFDAIKSQINDLLNHIKDYPIDEMSMLKDKYTWEEFLMMAYHAFKDDIMKKYTIYQIIVESKKKNIDNDFERAYLLDNDKRATIRRAIENFDDMNPKGRGGVLSSFHLAALYLWSSIDCGQKEFYNYFWEIYKGKYPKVSISCFSDMITLIYGHNKAKQSEEAKQSEKAERYKKRYEKFVEEMKNNGFYI